MVALVIIYNHRYDNNIPKIEEIYSNKFKNIFHLVPFYDGTKENVIAVYENSFYFEGYVAQAKYFLKKQGKFDHFLFIGDDLILNPQINESNYKDYFNIDLNASFLPNYIELSTKEDYWDRLLDAVNYRFSIRGLEIENQKPNYDEAINKFREKNLTEPFVISKLIYKLPKRNEYSKGILGYIKYIREKKRIKELLKIEKIKLEYPLVGSYSDIFIISNNNFDRFTHLCGVFSASKLFVELALPTAMVLSCDKIITENDLSMKGITFWTHEENVTFQKQYNLSINDLFSSFPKDALYFHPVKLSKWKFDK